MKQHKYLMAVTAAAALMGLGSAAQADQAVVTVQTAPAPIVEVVPAPREGYAWIPGSYEFRNGNNVWVTGHWVPSTTTIVMGAPPAVVYERDRDRDGIADSMDDDKDNDGLPNRYDRHPNNPHRR